MSPAKPATDPWHRLNARYGSEADMRRHGRQCPLL